MNSNIQQLLALSPETRSSVLAQLRTSKLPELAASTRTEPALARVPGEESPASYWQEQMWYLEQLSPGSPVYNVPFRFDLSGPLHVGALTEAWTEIERRHEILRSRLLFKGGQVVQIVLPPRRFPLDVVDLSHLKDPEFAADRYARAYVRSAPNLDKGHAHFASLLKLDPAGTRYVLLWVASHAIADGWSVGVLVRELAKLYTSFAESARPALRPLQVQFSDYARWQRALLGGERKQVLLDYWKTHLAGYELLQVPTDHPRPAVQTFEGETVEFQVDATTSTALHSLALRSGVTPFVTLFTAYKVLMAGLSRQTDILVATAMSGRESTQLESLIGSFVNTVPMRTRLDGDPSFAEAVQRVQQVALGAMAHQQLPFGKLVEAVAPQRDRSRSTLCQTFFLFGSTPMLTSDMELGAGVRLAWNGVSTRTVKFELDLAVDARADGLSGRLDYRSDLFDRRTAERICRAYVRVLEQVAHDPTLHISQLVAAALAGGDAEAHSEVHARQVTPELTPQLTAAEPADDAELEHEDVRRTVVHVWSSLLNLNEPDLRADFFAAGGHSVLAAQLVARLREDLEIDLTLPDFLENTTLEHLIARVEALCAAGCGTGVDAILQRVERMNDDEVRALLRAFDSESASALAVEE